MEGKKICVIGAGPSGMSLLCWAAKLAREGRDVPQIVCYEKQSNWGGLWNYNWRTGTDEHGEPVHGSMYRNLWINGPKEGLEFPHYTFEKHFGQAVPSYPPREVLFDYLQGRWNQEDVRKNIKFSHVVRDVVYNTGTDNFTVVAEDLENKNVLEPETFDFVVVATGHFSVANIPTFPGVGRFPGRVLHSHDFRDAAHFTGKRMLLIGGSYSAEDIALQCYKYGAKQVIISWKSRPIGLPWPETIEERPLVERFDGNTALFKDGTTAEVDVVVMCTGYLHSYPFLRFFLTDNSL